MKRYLRLLIALPSLWCWLIPTGLCGGEPQVKVEQVLQTMQTWDSSPYTSYPSGQPEITVLKITIPPNTALHWHRHPVISAAYVLSGHLTIEKQVLQTMQSWDSSPYTSYPSGQPQITVLKILSKAAFMLPAPPVLE